MTENPVTVRAVVVSYQGGRSAVAVARNGVLVASLDVEVGRLVCHAHHVEGCAPCLAEQDKRLAAKVRAADRTMFRREIEQADVDAAAVAIVDALVSHHVERLTIEAPDAKGEGALRGAWIVSAVRDALPASVEVETAPRGTSRAGGAIGVASAILGAQPAKRPAAAPPAGVLEVATGVVEVRAHPPVVEVEPPGVDVAPALAPRVAGIDPGTKRVAVVVGEGATAPLRFVASKVFPLKDAKDSAEIGRLVGEALAFLSKYGVERVSVERAVFGQSKDGGGMLPAVVGSLLLSAHVGGELAGAIRAWFAQGDAYTIATAPVIMCSSLEWRNAVCDAVKVERRMGPKGRPLKRTRGEAYPAVRALFADQLPGDVDTLDAAGACLWTARQAVKVERAPRPEGTKGPRASKHAKRNAERAAKRAAAGCQCEPNARGRVVHVDGCPIKMAADAKRSASMQGNRNRAGKDRERTALEALAEGKRLPPGTIRVPMSPVSK